MNTIYRKVPCNENVFDSEEEQRLETFICPLHTEQHQKYPTTGKKTRSNRNLQRFGKVFLTRPKQISEENLMEEEEEEVTPFNFFAQMQQKPWFTVIPIGVVRPEEVKVKLNPLCRLLVIKATPLMRRTSTKEIHRIVTLPKNIRMEKLQVKLTPRGELVVMAPFKIQQGQETLTTPFFEQQGRDLLSTLKWITIPIKNYRETIRNKKRQQPFFPFQETESESETSSSSSSSSSSSEESSTSESESETETENEEMMWPLHNKQQRETGTIRNLQFQVQNYVQLLQKIFYPNVVVAKIIRAENTTKITTTQTQQLQVALDVKFVDFRAEEIKVRMHETKRRVLIVEAKKVRQFREPQFGSLVKFVRREFELPQWLNVKNIVYRVLPTGVLRIKLPLLTTPITGTNTFQHGITQQRRGRGQQMGCPCLGFTVKQRCPLYKKYQKPVRAVPHFF